MLPACICGVAFFGVFPFSRRVASGRRVVGSDGSGDFKTIVSSVPRSPRPNEIPAWTLDGKWNPKKQPGPTIQQARVIGLQISVGFTERVTVKAKPDQNLPGRHRELGLRQRWYTLVFELGSDADNEVGAGDLDHRLRSFRCPASGVPVIARVAPKIMLCKDQSHDDGYGHNKKLRPSP